MYLGYNIIASYWFKYNFPRSRLFFLEKAIPELFQVAI
jgi:hypothetical protein